MPRSDSQSKENPLVKFLENSTVLTSSELIGRLKDSGLTDAAARQAIRRNSRDSAIWRSEKLRLPKNERLFALRSTVGDSAFYRTAGQKLQGTSRQGLSRCLATLSERLVLHKVDLMKLLAVSEDGSGVHASKRRYEHELAALEEIGVTVIHRHSPLESVAALPSVNGEDADELANLASTSVRREVLLTRVFGERLRKQNMCSWNLLELPDAEQPYRTFNGQVFSSYAFSYLSPLVRWKKGSSQPTACPVLIDVHQGVCFQPNVDSFLQRIGRATRRGRSFLPSLGVIAAKDFATDAWKHARRKGLMTVSFRQIFGDEALEAMVQVEELLHCVKKGEASSTVEQQFQTYSVLLEELKTNPVVATLRAIALEAIGGLALRSRGYECVELGRIVPWKDTTRDVDVFGFRDDELRILECKAYHKHKSIPPEDVTKFFTQTVPALKKWIVAKGMRKFKTCRAEIWTTGPLGNKARDELYQLKAPKTDEWKMVRGTDLEGLLPDSIRERGLELLHAIAMERSDDGSSNGTDGS